jgi:hypothetical protein
MRVCDDQGSCAIDVSAGPLRQALATRRREIEHHATSAYLQLTATRLTERKRQAGFAGRPRCRMHFSP